MADAAPARPWYLLPRLWVGAWIVWFVVLFILSSIPGTSLPNPFDLSDKVEHAGYFFGGGGLLGGWIVSTGTWKRRWWWIVAVAALVGAFDEAHQWFTPFRSALDVYDWLADVTGGLLATGVVSLWVKRLRRTHGALVTPQA